MAVKKKPKKAFIQIAIALVIAAVLGVIAIFVTISIINQMGAQNQAAIEAKQKEQEALEKKLAAAQAAASKMQKQDFYEVQATMDIEPGEIITQHMVERIETDLRAGATTIVKVSDAIGKVAASKILQGQALDRKTLMSADGLIQVKEGQRAVTIKVDNFGTLNGAITPGTMVDILTTIEEKSGSEKYVITKTLLQNIQVVATSDTSSGVRSSSIGSVTVAVTPKQAEMLVLANEVGKFHLTKRSFSDKKKLSSDGADVASLLTGLEVRKSIGLPPSTPPPMSNIDINAFNDLPAPAVPMETAPKYQMQIYQGSSSSTVEFGL